MAWCKKIVPGMSQAFKNVLSKEARIKGLCHQDVNLVLAGYLGLLQIMLRRGTCSGISALSMSRESWGMRRTREPSELRKSTSRHVIAITWRHN